MQIRCDVLVIGGGPSGSTASKFSAKKGLKVILIDEKKEIGIPIRCAGYVPWQIKKEVELKDDIIAQRIEDIITYFPNGEKFKEKIGGFIIHRNLLDKQLADEASDEGAKILLNTKAIGFRDGYVFAKRNGDLLKIKPDFIIGADGPNSIVGRWIKQRNKEFILTAQAEIGLLNSTSTIEVYFHKFLPGGYGWLFPKEKKANVGLGVDMRYKINPKIALKKFIEILSINSSFLIPHSSLLKVITKAIPVGGILKRLFYKNMCLVGDAAGVTHPLTGAGILNAIVSGKMAGDDFYNYEEECKFLFEEPLQEARKKKNAIDWSLNNEKLSLVLKKIWR